MFSLEVIKNFLGSLIFLIFGLHLIVNNKVVSLNLLTSRLMFKTKIIKQQEIDHKKLIDTRIRLYILGGLFGLCGLFFLIYSIKQS